MRYCSHRRGWVGFFAYVDPSRLTELWAQLLHCIRRGCLEAVGGAVRLLETCYAHSRMLLFHRVLFGFHRGELVTVPLVYQRGCSWVSSLSAPRTATLVASGDNPQYNTPRTFKDGSCSSQSRERSSHRAESAARRGGRGQPPAHRFGRPDILVCLMTSFRDACHRICTTLFIDEPAANPNILSTDLSIGSRVKIWSTAATFKGAPREASVSTTMRRLISSSVQSSGM